MRRLKHLYIIKKEIVLDMDDFSNLLREEMFSIFKNVNTLIIKDCYGDYSLSMIGLLALIEFGSLNEVIRMYTF